MSFDPEAYPTIPEEEVAAPPPRRKASPVQQQAEQAVTEYHQRVADAMKEQQAQAAVMTEARTRFAKASLYEQILAGSVFEDSNDHITLEVNAEFRDFAQQKLCSLLGIESESDKKKVKLSEEQVEVLAMMANSILARAGGSAKPQPPPSPPKVGKLSVIRRQPAQAPTQRPQPPPRPTYTLPAAPVQAPPQTEQLQLPIGATEGVNVAERTRPDGTTFRVNQGLSQVVPPKTTRSPKPKPMPDPNMQVALAAAEGDRNAGSSSIVQKVIAVSSAGGQ
jgi:hypothetical protein